MTTRTFPAALAIGMAQHTMRGEERPFVPMKINEEAKFVNGYVTTLRTTSRSLHQLKGFNSRSRARRAADDQAKTEGYDVTNREAG